MNKTFSLFTLLAFALTSQAQQADVIIKPLPAVLLHSFDYESRAFVDIPYFEISSEGGITSNFLNKDLVTQSYWPSDLVQNQINKLANVNRMGGTYSIDLSLHQRNKRIGKSSLSPICALSHDFISGMQANTTVVQTLLEGNKANREVLFSENNSYQTLQTTSLGLGVEWMDSLRTTRHQLVLDLIAGHSYLDFYSHGGSLLTDSIGERITGANTNISLEQSSDQSLPGMGLAINYSYSRKISRGRIGFDLQNLGVIRWASSKNFSVQPDFVFSGLDVTQAIRTSSSVNVVDSLNNEYLTETTENPMRILPVRVNVDLFYRLKYNAGIETEINYVYFPGYWPMLSTTYQQAFRSKVAVWKVGARIGGFGNYGLNLGIETPIIKRGGLTLDVVALESLVSSNLPVYWYANLGLRFNL
ncbi:MAG: hypothetical protein JJ975_05760 [Bacteroidia bacterium]|nr:hypothetical protein [Bacteroidia bacterium]